MTAKAILDKFPELTVYDVRSTSMGDTGADVKLSQRAREVFPHSVECKSHARFALYKNYEQAIANADGLIPTLVIKQNGSEPLVVLSLEDFMKCAY